jgi:quercetin dioxygenase-like cupin family protein
MKARGVLAVAVCLLAGATVLAQSEKMSKGGSKMSGAKATIMPAADLRWMDLDPTGAPGVKSVDLWGDHTKGAFGGLTKFPAGFTAPLHTHTNTMKIVVISGTFIHTPEGQPERRLTAGSYLLQPGGNYRHTTACDKASDCLFFIESTGKFDLKPVEEKRKSPEK